VINLLLDTTYFVRNFGLMVFKVSITSQILLKQNIKQKTNQLYLQGIQEIGTRGIKIQSITCDGRKGLLELFAKNIPVQMCQFHQVAIIRRYLTKKPKMQASKELWELVLILSKTDKESFKGGLQHWFNKWEAFLNERKIDVKD
jgi:transposase-like protein